MSAYATTRRVLSIIRHPGVWWRRMNPHSMLKFVLSMLRHPGQVRARVRELLRIANAPPVTDPIPDRSLADVEVVAVTSEPALREALVAIYSNNPSPYSRGPTSMDQLLEKQGRGLRFYLVRNNRGQWVGVRAFDPHKKLLRNTVTDFQHRGKGYQYAAGIRLREQLAAEGFREFHSVLLETNTRMLRMLLASGWEISRDAENPELVRGVLKLDD